MNLRSLQEDRRHGRHDLPVGLYRMAPRTGEPVLEMHWHAEYEFLAIERGKAIFQVGLSTYEVRAGEVLFIPGGELHGGFAADNGPGGAAASCAYSALVFDLDWLAARSGQDRPAAEWLLPLQRGEISLQRRLTREHSAAATIYNHVTALTAMETSDTPGKALRIKGGLLTLLAEYADAGLAVRQDPWNGPRTETPQRLIRVLAYMESHYDRKLAIAELADVAGMSEGHFSRLFKRYLRQPPLSYLNEFRLRRAAELLRKPDGTVAEAAMACGFDNFSYFSKQFRLRFHCSPAQYRKQ